MMGGTICPPVEATASVAPAVTRGTPERIISGMVNVPVTTTLAVDEPAMVPKKELDTIATFAGPPRKRPDRPRARSMNNWLAPVACRIEPNRMNRNT